MTYKQVTVRNGELLGPVDWSYNFRQHFDGYCCDDATKNEMCEKRKALLAQIERDPTAWRATFSHSDTSRQVYSVGMYDGWPYWKPTPAIMIQGVLGSEWRFFDDLQSVEKADGGK